MNNLNIRYNNKYYTAFSRESAVAANIPEEFIVEAELEVKRQGMIASRLQIRLVTSNSPSTVEGFNNLWDQIKEWFNVPGRSIEDIIYFEDALNWYRLDPIVINTARNLNISSESLDALFVAAMNK